MLSLSGALVVSLHITAELRQNEQSLNIAVTKEMGWWWRAALADHKYGFCCVQLFITGLDYALSQSVAY